MTDKGKLRKMLFLSNLYPNSREPQRAAFNRQQIIHLRRYFEVDIVAPVSWIQRAHNRDIPDFETLDDMRVFHPTYYYIPRFVRRYQGYYYYWSVRSVVKELLRKNKYAFIYSSWLYPDGWAASRLAVEHGLPVFIKVHGTDVNRLKKGEAVTILSLDAVSNARKVICVSKNLMERLSIESVDISKLVLLYNGVDKSIFFPRDKSAVRKELGIPLDNKIILFVGNLKQEKGLDELAHAMRSLSEESESFLNVRLIIIGEGPYRNRFRRTLKECDVEDKITFLGNLSSENVSNWMCASDVLCLPSYTEGIPNVVIEALSCCVPVVATDVGGIPEINTYGQILKMVPPKDSYALAREIKKVLNGIPCISRTHPVGTWTWEENAANLARIFMGKCNNYCS